ncbi:MAG: hypothetical protein HOP12_15070 [Candidatus Eisenbacteria bacterium]|uniref:Asl1-like glycosyl hydrolase catalytic domain-containing protein n=1 Tax=Eiseniibacteriota bacterium TaxID=2212470 RepID=A0A849STP6_UNCEI|nr:hypothetical protein [Candidatus Eisenbacteria bacterium]
MITPLWNEIENVPGALNVSNQRLYLQVFRAFGFTSFVNLRPVDTNQRGTPPDLAGLAWDDPTMLARWDVALDSLIELVRETPQIALAVGNEVDGYFSSHLSELPAFIRFYRHSLARLHAALPGIPIGIVTGAPVGNPDAWIGDTLNAYSDIVLYTYYPFDAGTDFQHRLPATFEPDMAQMRSRARALNKPIAFTEIGYASSPACNSSDAAQAEFVRRFKTYFRAVPRSEALFANYFLLTDWSSGTLQILFDYYRFVSPGFAGYLGTLGLRDTLGAPKPAWEAWKGVR